MVPIVQQLELQIVVLAIRVRFPMGTQHRKAAKAAFLLYQAMRYNSACMNHSKSELYFVFVVIAGVSALSFFVFKPFLFVIILALVFATVFAPLHRRLARRLSKHPSAAAFLATLLIVLIIIAPVAFVTVRVFKESSYVYSFLTSSGGETRLAAFQSTMTASLKKFVPLPADFALNFTGYLKDSFTWLVQHLGLVFSNIARVFLETFIFVLALYFFLRDGKKIRRDIESVSPLSEQHSALVLGKLEKAVNSVIRGSLAVALAQGAVSSIGFIIFGVPNAALWGLVTACAALVPSIGTALVIAPAVLFLFFTGHMAASLGLLVWGLFAVGLIDNFLGPKLVEKGTQLHPFLILLSILGGVGFFGPLGFVLGPLSLSLLFAFFEVYKLIENPKSTS